MACTALGRAPPWLRCCLDDGAGRAPPPQVVNRLQRELEAVVRNYHVLERRLEAEGINVSTISQLEPLSTNTECARGRHTPPPSSLGEIPCTPWIWVGSEHCALHQRGA